MRMDKRNRFAETFVYFSQIKISKVVEKSAVLWILLIFN